MKKLVASLVIVPSFMASTGILSAQKVVPDTGIRVGEPKVYDDQSLAAMLNAARAQLGTLRPIDQTTLLSHIGAVQGASLTQSSFGLQVNGLPAAGVTTTTNTGTPSIAQTLGATTATAAGATSSSGTTTNQTVTTTPSNTTQTVVTQPQVTAPTVTPPAPTATLPASSGFGISALNTLNEQMQLTSEIASLELLLEGALSDRIVAVDNVVKTRTTVGFPITIAIPPDVRVKNAVAEVEIRIRNGSCIGPANPSLVTILPREKTYNVANITDKSVSIGGGVVTQVASVGATWLWGHKTYYLVQEQDTIAVENQPGPPDELVFGWQFRPVLGQSLPSSGIRQTFVQVAFESLIPDASPLATVEVVTRWRKYDAKTGTAGRVIMESAAVESVIPQFATPMASSVRIEDAGGGQITVTAGGAFLTGTRVRMGSTILGDGSPNFSLTSQNIQFTAPAVAAAVNKPKLVTRDGTEVDLVNDDYRLLLRKNGPVICSGPIADDEKGPPAEEKPTSLSLRDRADLLHKKQADASKEKQVVISGVSVRPYTDTQSEVMVQLSTEPNDGTGKNPLLAVIGNKLFGLSDAPFLERTPKKLRFVAPNDAINNYHAVTVKRLFWGDNFNDTANLTLQQLSYDTVSKVNLLSTGDDTVFAVSGIGVDKIRVLSPKGATLETIELKDRGKKEEKSHLVDTTTILMHITADQLKPLKQFVFQVNNEPPIIMAVPTDAKPVDSKPSLKAQDPIAPGTGITITISGTGLDGIKSIKYLKTTLNFRLALDKKSLTVDLPAEVTSTEGVRFLDVTYTDGTTARYEIDVKKKQ